METLSEIVAQMRGRGEDGRMDRRLWLEYADRINAAWRREKAEIEANALAVGGVVEAARHKPGNAAALREAVVALIDALDSLGCDEDTAALAAFVPDMADSSAKCLAAFRKAKEALSAPARQCDVGTAEEQNRRFDNFCRGKDCKTCPCNVMPRCHMVWAQTPYAAQEGGAE